MRQLIWTTCYSVGIPELDQQHQRVISMVNLLISDIDIGSEPEMIAAALSGVTRYTNEHFATEEQFLLDRGYPELEAHRRAHREYRRAIIKLCHDTWLVDPHAPAKLARFLRSWWLEHIIGEDMGYREFLQDRGLTS